MLAEARFYARTPGQSDRHELRLADFVAQVQTGAQATRTHLWITVANPSQFQVEAVLRLPIPPGAAVTRAVLHVGAEAVEGAFVGRDRARQIYRSITERRRDPALITWSGPEWIEATVFPVEKSDQRTLELEWIEPSAGHDGTLWYRVPVIAHEGKQAQRPSRITVDGVAMDGRLRAWLPLGTVGTIGTAATARSPGDPFAYAFAPAEARKPGPPRLVLVAETSRSMTPASRKRQRALLDALLGSLPEDAGVTLLAADWAIASVADNKHPAEVRAALAQLDGIPSAGALDLESALLTASARAGVMCAPAIVYLGAGVDDFQGDALAAPLRRMQESSQTLIVVGGEGSPIADAAALTGGQALPWASTAETLVRVLALLERTPPKLALPSSERFFPLETVTGETRWLARFVGAAPDELGRADERDLEALWARAHVAATSGQSDDEGQSHRVLTPLTSILVLESTADYARWGIPEPTRDHAAFREGKGEQHLGILAARAAREAPARGPGALLGLDSAAGGDAVNVLGNLIGEAPGVGGLGLLGTGAGGGGLGEGTMGLGNFGTMGKGATGKGGSGYGRRESSASRRPESAPAVVLGEPKVRGSLDKEIIRRIIRRHANEVKYCYEQELVRRPGLAGRVTVQFVISPSGEVISSLLQSSTLNNPRTESCIVQAVRRWAFPKPSGGGIVIVGYPFTLTPSNDWREAAWTAPPSPPPPSQWDLGLAALRGTGAQKDRLAKVAGILTLPATDSAAVLAWRLVERDLRRGVPVPAACLLAANLLREAALPHEAARVLSEAAVLEPATATAEFRRWASPQDLARLTELAARK